MRLGIADQSCDIMVGKQSIREDFGWRETVSAWLVVACSSVGIGEGR